MKPLVTYYLTMSEHILSESLYLYTVIGRQETEREDFRLLKN